MSSLCTVYTIHCAYIYTTRKDFFAIKICVFKHCKMKWNSTLTLARAIRRSTNIPNSFTLVHFNGNNQHQPIQHTNVCLPSSQSCRGSTTARAHHTKCLYKISLKETSMIVSCARTFDQHKHNHSGSQSASPGN